MFQRRRPPFPTIAAATALLACLTLAAGCKGATLRESSEPATTEVGDATAPGPITSGASPLQGMRGARPGFDVDADFRRRVLEVDPGVTDFVAAAEGYDAATIVAIATETTRNDAPGRIAGELVGTTEGGRTCNTFLRCRALALQNRDYDYEGVSGEIEMLANGDPGQAGFAIVEFDGTGALRTIDRVAVQATALEGLPPEPDTIYGPPGDGVLTLGTLLPTGGPSPAVAAAALAGVRLAVNEINGLGGVLDTPVVLLADETGDGSPAATSAAATNLLGQRVDAVIGGTTYAVTSEAIGQLTDAGIVMVSPTDTARAWSVAADRGLFFRVAASTDLEGEVLGGLVTDDGYTRVAIIAGSDGDDLELASDITGALNAATATVTATVAMGPGGDAAAAVREALASDPQAIVIATPRDVAAALLGELVVLGKGPAAFPTYGTAANMTTELAAALGG